METPILMIFLIVCLLAFLLLYGSLPTYFSETQKNLIFLFGIGTTIIVFFYVILKK